jgi:GTP 3',8-cyclase
LAGSPASRSRAIVPSAPGAAVYAYWGGGSLYLNLTSRCPLECAFCLRNFTWEVYGYDLRLSPDQEPTAEQVLAAVDRELAGDLPEEIVFTGLGEPTLRPDVLLAVTRSLSERGFRLRLDTNGQGRRLGGGPLLVKSLVDAGLAAVSVSLNAPDARSYAALCAPGRLAAFGEVVGFIGEAVRAGLEVTATAVDTAQIDLEKTASLAAGLGASFRIRRLVTPGKRPTG